MKATYDISVVPRNYCNSKYVHDLYNFLDSKHQSAKLEYDTKREAERAYHAFHGAKSRYKIYDVKIARQDNIVYIARVDSDLSGITNYDRIRNMSVNELAEFLDKVESAGYNDSSITPMENGNHMDMIDWLKSEGWDADRTN